MNIASLWGNPFKINKSDRKSDIGFLSTVPVFDTLTRRQKYQLYSIIHVRHFNAGEVIFRQDDPGVGLYIIRDGGVDVYNEYSDMTRHKITELTQGDFFGEIALMNNCPRSATVIATQNTVLFGLFRTDFLNLLDSDPKLGVRVVYRLAKILAERLRQINEDTAI